MLTLSKALKEKRLQEFIDEREAAGVGPISEKEFNSVASTVIKSGQSEDQTSRSVSPGDSTGKQTR